jgi:hypothetical protein
VREATRLLPAEELLANEMLLQFMLPDPSMFVTGTLEAEEVLGMLEWVLKLRFDSVVNGLNLRTDVVLLQSVLSFRCVRE